MIEKIRIESFQDNHRTLKSFCTDTSGNCYQISETKVQELQHIWSENNTRRINCGELTVFYFEEPLEIEIEG